MSHFSVALIHDKDDDIDALLAPYYQGSDGSPDYMEFAIEVPASEVDEFISSSIRGATGENKSEAQKLASTPDEFMMWYSGYEKDSNGNYGYWTNFNAKWDWYSIGGRYANLLILKKNKKPFNEMGSTLEKTTALGKLLQSKDDFISCSSARIKDIDFDKSTERYGHKGLTWAILTNREWIEPGSVGWFGQTNATQNTQDEFDENYMKIIKKNSSPNSILTIIDCHI